MSQEAKTSVWWDIENCHPPSGIITWDISNNIRSVLKSVNHSGPITVSAYGDMLQFSRDVQKALSSTGVILNHIPSGGKDSSDKAILMNLAFWSQDNAPPANILLISGDADFAPMLHRLHMRNFNVLLARPDGVQVSKSLLNAASTVWYWSRLARGETKMLTLPMPSLRAPTETKTPLRTQMSTVSSKAPPDTIAKALQILKQELMIPTASNIHDCVAYWMGHSFYTSSFLNTMLTNAVDAGSLDVIIADGEKVWLPNGCKLWDFVNPKYGQTYDQQLWDEFDNFLSGYEPWVQDFLNSRCLFEAAFLLKKYAADPLATLALGKLCDLVQQAISVKAWLRPHPENWSPLIIIKHFRLERSAFSLFGSTPSMFQLSPPHTFLPSTALPRVSSPMFSPTSTVPPSSLSVQAYPLSPVLPPLLPPPVSTSTQTVGTLLQSSSSSQQGVGCKRVHTGGGEGNVENKRRKSNNGIVMDKTRQNALEEQLRCLLRKRDWGNGKAYALSSLKADYHKWYGYPLDPSVYGFHKFGKLISTCIGVDCSVSGKLFHDQVKGLL